jgi:hypothetical protein
MARPRNGGTNRAFNRLTVDDAGVEGVLVSTIATARVQSFSGDYLSDGDRKVVLTLASHPDKDYVVNATSFHLLCDRYSNDKANGFKAWVGKDIVLTRVETDNPQNSEKVMSLWVARPKEWDTAIRASGGGTRGRGRSRS